MDRNLNLLLICSLEWSNNRLHTADIIYVRIGARASALLLCYLTSMESIQGDLGLQGIVICGKGMEIIAERHNQIASWLIYQQHCIILIFQ